MNPDTVKYVDLRIKDPARAAAGRRSEELCWKLNQMNPSDPDRRNVLEELLEGRIGEGSWIQPPLFINQAQFVTVGSDVIIMNGLKVMSMGGLDIEDHVRISLNCTIATNDHDMYDREILICKPVRIRENAWLGVNVTVMPGVIIGKNAVIGAGSVVTKDIPDNAVAVGVPAKVIKYLDPEKFEKLSS